MLHSESIGKISAALAKAQGAMEDAAKSGTGNYGKYADLASIWDACREPLASNEIAVVQAPGATADKAIEMTTILSHSSGEWFKETLTIPMQRVDAQGYGSAVTYARRYALAAMVGIAPAEDDGQAAATIGGDNNAPRRQTRPEPAPPPETKNVEEPPEGWSVWSLGFMGHLEAVETVAAIDAARDDEINKRRINALRTIDPSQYKAIGEAFAAARARLAPAQKKAA